MEKTKFHIKFASPQIGCCINLVVRNGVQLSEILGELQNASGLDINSMDVYIHGVKMVDDEMSMPIETIWMKHSVDSGWKDELSIVWVPSNQTYI